MIAITWLPLQDPHAEEFEDKEWTFVIENVSTVKQLLDYMNDVLDLMAK